ncbi:hypothetical protein [Tropicimonas sp. IMCC6043]|nr:hypothetical protein [Tropicimonas sp. IMCC6043]
MIKTTGWAPRGAQPVVLIMLVFKEVSSMKAKRGRNLRMKG